MNKSYSNLQNSIDSVLDKRIRKYFDITENNPTNERLKERLETYLDVRQDIEEIYRDYDNY